MSDRAGRRMRIVVRTERPRLGQLVRAGPHVRLVAASAEATAAAVSLSEKIGRDAVHLLPAEGSRVPVAAARRQIGIRGC